MSARDLPFGSDTHGVDSLEQMSAELRDRLVARTRVLKQRRGHSGIGVWRVEQRDADHFALRHAQRGSVEQRVDLAGLPGLLAPYFNDGGHMIDQAWQPRMVEGMTRPSRPWWRRPAKR